MRWSQELRQWSLKHHSGYLDSRQHWLHLYLVGFVCCINVELGKFVFAVVVVGSSAVVVQLHPCSGSGNSFAMDGCDQAEDTDH